MSAHPFELHRISDVCLNCGRRLPYWASECCGICRTLSGQSKMLEIHTNSYFLTGDVELVLKDGIASRRILGFLPSTLHKKVFWLNRKLTGRTWTQLKPKALSCPSQTAPPATSLQ